MIERKQSFLERLTGARVVDEYTEEHVSSQSRSGRAKIAVRAHEEPVYRQMNMREEDLVEEEEIVEEEEEEVEAGLAIDMYESDNELVIQSMIAGVTTENLQVAITRDMVTIRGKRIPLHGIPESRYIERELYWGVFSREIQLPFEIDTDGAEAVEKYGLLIIRLPKLDSNRMQELKVKSI